MAASDWKLLDELTYNRCAIFRRVGLGLYLVKVMASGVRYDRLSDPYREENRDLGSRQWR